MQSETPEGLSWIYTAANAVEADMLRQVLTDAGFHVEFVPSQTTGMFGTSGNVDIYVAANETEAATAFLSEYLGPENTAE